MPPLPPLDTKSTHLSDQNDLEAPQSGRSERQSVSSRAKWLAPLLLLAALGARFLGFGVPWTGETRVKGLLERAYELLDEYPLIDGHNDLPIRVRSSFQNLLANVSLTDLPPKRNAADANGFSTSLSRLRDGRVASLFWSVYVPCTDFTVWSEATRMQLEQIDLVKRMIEKYPDDLALVTKPEQIEELFNEGRKRSRSGRWRVGSMLGMEGGHGIDGSLGALRMFKELGVSYMTLTHVCHTSFADSAALPPLHHGLTPFGRSVIAEMNRLGMLVDLAHVSGKTARDALQRTRAPVIWSHSATMLGGCEIPRNVPTSLLPLVVSTHSLIMVNFFPGFLTCSQSASLSALIDHIVNLTRKIGAEHVGLGSDFDGIPEVPGGMEGVEKFPALVAGLLEAGLSAKEVGMIVGGNLIRVWKEVERIGKKLREQGARVEEEPEGMGTRKYRCPNSTHVAVDEFDGLEF